jgi:hypothetical protein
MDNKIFNVNGRDLESLINTVYLALSIESYKPKKDIKFCGYVIDPVKGLIPLQYEDKLVNNFVKFPAPISVEILCNLVYGWLSSEDALKTPMLEWEGNVDHDGDNEIGWRVYCEDWGKIYTSDNRSIDGVIAIKPVYLWYGK